MKKLGGVLSTYLYENPCWCLKLKESDTSTKQNTSDLRTE